MWGTKARRWGCCSVYIVLANKKMVEEETYLYIEVDG
jgi:hypothetical protein